MATTLTLNAAQLDKLHQSMLAYQGNTEAAINDVLHNDASVLAQGAIKNLIPVSGKTWNGKKPAAKTAKSLTNVNGNLSVTVKTTKNYQYLYFPDDGSNTTRHVGNQQFFHRGGSSVQDEIVQRCINKLVNEFNEGV